MEPKDEKARSIWEPLRFCLCGDEEEGARKTFDECRGIVERLFVVICDRCELRIIHEELVELQQKDYHDEAMFCKLFIFEMDGKIFIVHANIVLAPYFSGKWHREVEKVYAWRHELLDDSYLPEPEGCIATIDPFDDSDEDRYDHDAWVAYEHLEYIGNPTIPHINVGIEALDLVELTKDLERWSEATPEELEKEVAGMSDLDAISLVLLYFHKPIPLDSGK